MDKQSIHWCNAETLCAPKAVGGLGFRDFRYFNLALVGKQAWRILECPDALWVRLLKSLYFPSTDFLSSVKGSRPSWIWSSLCGARPLLSLGAFKVLGDGNNIRISSDPWLPNMPNLMFTGLSGSHQYVSEWILTNPRGWDWSTIALYCDENHMREIQRIPIGPPGLNDEWKWKFTKDGAFSVRSAYHAFKEYMAPPAYMGISQAETKQWKWLWSLSLPPKILFFLWRCCKNGLATNTNLLRRNCATSPTCPVCNSQDETLLHCLFLCHHAQSSWLSIPGIPTPGNSNDRFFTWFMALQDSPRTTDATNAAAMCWNIWKARNECVFRGAKPCPSFTGANCVIDANDWRTTSASRGPTSHTLTVPPPHSQPATNPPPCIPTRAIHCDGSFIDDVQKAAYGITISNTSGQVTEGRAGTFYCSSPIVSEARAIYEAAILASQSIEPSNILSDCLELVKAISGPRHRWPWRCYGYLGGINTILQSRPNIKVNFISRRLNTKADWVARSAQRGSLPVNWTLDL
ncbi:Putative ribonuclease H protein At1g65750 [Linum perenne]